MARRLTILVSDTLYGRVRKFGGHEPDARRPASARAAASRPGSAELRRLYVEAGRDAAAEAEASEWIEDGISEELAEDGDDGWDRLRAEVPPARPDPR